MPNLLHELEAMVVDAWPAAETLERDGWLLRASGGPTHRGNAVATLDATGVISLDARIDDAEAWYRQRARPALFQVGPCAAPSGLDAALAARGYVIEGAARFAAAPAKEVLTRTAATAGAQATRGTGMASPGANAATTLRAFVEPRPNAAWLDVNRTTSRFAGQVDSFLGFIARLGERCRFVTVHAPSGEREPRDPSGPATVDGVGAVGTVAAVGAVAAVGLGIASGNRLGIYAMLTVPAFRRQGAARAALHALAGSALSDGLSELYLLFEPGNTAARELYERSGFRDVYGYHYRGRPLGNGQ